MTRNARMKDQGCLIIGGTGGIGLATARRFLEEGARVVVSGLVDAEVDIARTALDGVGPNWAHVADVRSAESVRQLFTASVAWLGGRLDVLVHVAGISGRKYGDGPLDTCTDSGWEQVLRINARGAFLTNQAAVKQMLAQTIDPVTGMRGAVVNIGSVLSHAPSPRHFGTIAYAASKGAMRAMTRAAAADYAAEKVRFNLIEPALIDTPMSRRAVQDPSIAAYLRVKQPLSEGPGQADDIAEAVLALAEPAAKFITGAVLQADGGWCLSSGDE